MNNPLRYFDLLNACVGAVVMGGLALGRVPYNKWLVFVWPLLVLLAIMIVVVLSLGAMLS